MRWRAARIRLPQAVPFGLERRACVHRPARLDLPRNAAVVFGAAGEVLIPLDRAAPAL